jgi:alkyl hydroperoxide reductase subunit AhpC
LEPGDPAPDFQARTIDGKGITLSDLKGKIIILAFWKRDQDYSEKILADLEPIYQEYRVSR